MVETLGFTGEGGSAEQKWEKNLGVRESLTKVTLLRSFSPATVIVRGPSLESAPTHSTIDPSSIETLVTVIRVAVTIPPPRTVRSPWNTNIGLLIVPLDVTVSVNVTKSVVNPRLAPSGGVRSHLMKLPLMVQVKRTLSSGHATLALDIKVPVEHNYYSRDGPDTFKHLVCSKNYHQEMERQLYPELLNQLQ